jgi:hypothetical protein
VPPLPIRFLLELASPYREVLFDLADANERTYQQQAVWILKRYLDTVIRKQDTALERCLQEAGEADDRVRASEQLSRNGQEGEGHGAD